MLKGVAFVALGLKACIRPGLAVLREKGCYLPMRTGMGACMHAIFVTMDMSYSNADLIIAQD